MKRKIAVLMMVMGTIALLVCCAGVSKVKVPGVTTAKVGPLAKIMVFKGKLLPGEAGKARSEAMLPTIKVDESIVLTAMGRDAEDNDIAIKPTWTPTTPGIVEITPAVGPTVTIKGLKKGSTDLLIEFSGIKRKFETIYVE